MSPIGPWPPAGPAPADPRRSRHPDILLLTAAVGALFLTALYLAVPRLRLFRPASPTYYPAPLFVSSMSNLKVEAVAVGQRPRGFPRDLPLYEATTVFQAYRTSSPGSSAYSATIIFQSDRPASEVLSFYAEWLGTNGWTTELQPTEDPRAVGARQADRSLSVTVASLDPELAHVVISYGE